jgi:hypothetical protein
MNKNLHPVVKELLAEIDAYRAMAGVNATEFGLWAMKDGTFIARLKRGRSPSLETIDRVRKYIASKSKAARPRK